MTRFWPIVAVLVISIGAYEIGGIVLSAVSSRASMLASIYQAGQRVFSTEEDERPRGFQPHAMIAIDGDTFREGDLRYRLAAVDACELDQTFGGEGREGFPCGRLARDLLQEHLDTGVPCHPRLKAGVIAKDRYGRVLVNCFDADGVDIEEALVRAGLAVASRPDQGRSPFLTLIEEKARVDQLGAWAHGSLDPKAWRASQATKEKR
ncbi:MAG: thermonuclease family protein [Pseudomonadota bacterium]